MMVLGALTTHCLASPYPLPVHINLGAFFALQPVPGPKALGLGPQPCSGWEAYGHKPAAALSCEGGWKTRGRHVQP